MNQLTMIYKIHDPKTNEWNRIEIKDIEQEVNRQLNCEKAIAFTPSNSMALNYYLLKYWMPVLGPDNFAMLLVMIQEAYEHDQFCDLTVLELAERCGKTGRTYAHERIKVLEKYGFVCKIQRMYVGGKKNESNIYYVLPTTPYLPDEIVNAFSERKKYTYHQDIKRWTSPKSIRISDIQSKEKEPTHSRREGSFYTTDVDKLPTQRRTLSEDESYVVDNSNNLPVDNNSSSLREDGPYANAEGKSFKNVLKDLKTRKIEHGFELVQLASKIKQGIEQKIEPLVFQTFFGEAEISIQDNCIVLMYELMFTKEFAETRYKSVVYQVASELHLIGFEIEFVTK